MWRRKRKQRESRRHIPSLVPSVVWSADQYFVVEQLASNPYCKAVANHARPTLSQHYVLGAFVHTPANIVDRLSGCHCRWLWLKCRSNILHRQSQDSAPYQPVDGCDAQHLCRLNKIHTKKYNSIFIPACTVNVSNPMSATPRPT